MNNSNGKEKSFKAFIIPYEAWYKDAVLGEPCICVGMYYESGGTDGEFRFVWEDIGIQLRIYDDSWEMLSRMPELIDLMGRIQAEELKPTIKEFAEMLESIGFKDITERERKEADDLDGEDTGCQRFDDFVDTLPGMDAMQEKFEAACTEQAESQEGDGNADKCISAVGEPLAETGTRTQGRIDAEEIIALLEEKAVCPYPFNRRFIYLDVAIGVVGLAAGMKQSNSDCGSSLIEAMAEEIENICGRETELTKKARGYLAGRN